MPWLRHSLPAAASAAQALERLGCNCVQLHGLWGWYVAYHVAVSARGAESLSHRFWLAVPCSVARHGVVM